MMISRSFRLLVTVLICLLMLGAGGCKSKKKAMEAKNAAAEKARIEQEAAQRKQKEDDEARKREADERARAEAEAAAKKETTKSGPYVRLDQYFDAIAGSGNTTSANSSIAETLTLFSSQQTPVLIVISEEGGMKDYDKPTTIKAYLDYLKDQKKNLNTITNLQFDTAGKITEVELTRKK